MKLRAIIYTMFALSAAISAYGALMFGVSAWEAAICGVVTAAIGYYVVNAP